MRILLLIIILIGGFFLFQTSEDNPLEEIANKIITTKIGDILKNQRDYEGKTVTIGGKVTTSVNFGIKFFILNDGTGDMYISTQKPAPNKGEEMRITGKFSQFAKAGNIVIAVVTEE